MFEADLHIFEFQMFFSLLFPFAVFFALHLSIWEKSSKIQLCCRYPFCSIFGRDRRIFHPSDEKNTNFISIFGLKLKCIQKKGVLEPFSLFLCLIRVMLEFTICTKLSNKWSRKSYELRKWTRKNELNINIRNKGNLRKYSFFVYSLHIASLYHPQLIIRPGIFVRENMLKN